jgi:hypothetical protein
MPSINAHRSRPPLRQAAPWPQWLIAHTILIPAIACTVYVIPIVLPCALSITQALLLGSTFGSRRRWGSATLLGVLLGYVAWWVLWMIRQQHGDQRELSAADVAVALGVMGVCVGLPQAWLVGWAGGPAAWRWVLASAAGWLGLYGGGVLLPLTPTLMGFLGSLAVAGAAYGSITGLTLAWIVHDRRMAARGVPRSRNLVATAYQDTRRHDR